MIWEDTIKKKKYSYKRKKYPSTAQKKNKKLNRLSPAEREKKEEEMRDWSRQQQDSAKYRDAKKKKELAKKPFEEKINKLKEQKDDIMENVIDMFVCSKGHKIYGDKKFLEELVKARHKRNMSIRFDFCPFCAENISYDEDEMEILNKTQEALIETPKEIEKLKQQAKEESNSVYWKTVRGY
mgnify:CR=1 FL=1|tara:strand:- start:137 stop:682 length:546 start_codon:yes stop_codon:yes gene_type:complete